MSKPTPTGSVTYHVYLLPIPDGKELPSLALKNIPEPLGGEEHAVLASALHAALGVRKDFSAWINVQLKRARLEEGTDFVVSPLKGENPKGGRPRVEYLLSLDSAKHVAMLSGTERGAAVRRYFIAAEKELHGLGSSTSRTAVQNLGRLEQERTLMESAGSNAGRVLSNLRRVRKVSDAAMATEWQHIQPQLPGLDSDGGKP